MADRGSWKNIAIQFFNESPQKVFTRKELAKVLSQRAERLGTPRTLSAQRFIDTLEETGFLRRVTIESVSTQQDEPIQKAARNSDGSQEATHEYRPFTRYVWREASPYEVALSLRSGSYLSHASAVFLHGLTTQIPRTIYANKEQSSKPQATSVLTQESIDRAFRNRPRTSRYIFAYEQTRIILLNGKQTGNLEVSEVVDVGGRRLAATKLERTLIDIVVRPSYAAGVFEVQEAFRSARERASVATLSATLKRLAYLYPYHQALGFYMQRAGYPTSQLQRLKNIGINFNFYLTNQMPNPRLDRDWRVYYPEGL